MRRYSAHYDVIVMQSLNRMPKILQTTFSLHFIKWNLSHFDSNITEVYSPGRGLITNKPPLIRVLALHRTDHKSLTVPMMVNRFTGVYMSHQGPLLLTWYNFNPIMDK